MYRIKEVIVPCPATDPLTGGKVIEWNSGVHWFIDVFKDGTHCYIIRECYLRRIDGADPDEFEIDEEVEKYHEFEYQE